jgi:N-acetylmannosamine-6-phosphate 2-epimerase/N-acetylmannosamine kinase
MMLDPKHIVIGGGIGLAAGYLDRMRDCLAGIGTRLTPVLVPARLGSRAGIIGVASLTTQRD